MKLRPTPPLAEAGSRTGMRHNTHHPGGVMARVARTAGLAFAVALSLTIQIDAQKWAVPRTPDGRPDLEGVWENNSATPLERPRQLADKPRLTDEELES